MKPQVLFDWFTRKEPALCFNDTLMRVIGIPLVGFFTPFVFFGFRPSIQGWDTFGKHWFISMIYTVIIWTLYRELVIYLRHKYPEPNLQQKRITIQSVVAISVFTPLNIFIGFALFKLVPFLTIENKPLTGASTFATLFNLAFITSLYEGVYFFHKYKETLVEKEKLQRENATAQLELLKSQVNPHFLFNSLNTLNALIYQNADEAAEFVQKLSKVYRYILEIRDLNSITLQQELLGAEAYIHLLKARFGGSIIINVNVESHFQKYHIVPLSLQILLENAVKHNAITSHNPLVIDIYTDLQERLVVKNNLIKKRLADESHSTQFGLDNIKKRSYLASGKEAEILMTGLHFIVILPLLENKLTPLQNIQA